MPEATRSADPTTAAPVVGAVQGAPVATHAGDPLTGLPGRSEFTAALDAIATVRPFAVVFIDLDGFKKVNTGLGRDAGDRLLQQVADRLRDAVRPDDVVARLGGDEFTVLCRTVDAVADAEVIAERLARSLDAPFMLDGQRRRVTASVGWRFVEPDAPPSHAMSALNDADAAMYQAKRRGGGSLQAFTDELQRELVERIQMEKDLRAAVQLQTLDLVHQPLVDITTGRVVGAESLLRWQRPGTGPVSPAEFVPLAEETGLILPIGAYVLRESCRRVAEWRARRDLPRHCRNLTTWVNVSTLQLAEPGFVDQVRDALAAAQIGPSALCLEVTEGALACAGTTLAVLNRLRELGVYVAVDDFGTGHSSLSRLKQLPVEVIKVDRGFVDGLGTEPGDSAIVTAILSMAHAIGLHVMAEGVETPEQARELQQLGCTVAQGWLWAPGVTNDAFVDLCRQGFGDVTRTPAGGRACPRRRTRVRLDGPESRRGQRGLVDELMHQIGIPMDER